MRTTLIYFDSWEKSQKIKCFTINFNTIHLVWFQILNYKKEGGLIKKFNYISDIFILVKINVLL